MEFRVLGPLEVWNGGRPFPIRGTRQRALLAMLLMRANEVVSSDRLLDELWGAEPPATGTKALQVRISQLRKALPRADVVETRSPGYIIRLDPHQLDLTRFEELLVQARVELGEGDARRAAETAGEALSLWRGPPLDDLASSPFVRGDIRRLEELRLVAVELRIDAILVLGGNGELIGELEALVAEHPLRERLREQLMLVLYRQGRQAEALAEYQEARDALVDELGIEPGAGLQRLHKAILLHDPALDLTEPPRDSPARSILVAVTAAASLAPLLTIGEPLARSLGPRELVLVGVVPAEQSDDLRPLSHALEKEHAALALRGTSSRSAAFTSSQPGRDISRFVADCDADLLLVQAGLDLVREGPIAGELAVVLAEATCDVAVLCDGALRQDGNVVVPFGGSEHEWTALELGVWLAHGLGVGVELVGTTAVPGEGRRDASRLLASAALVVQRLVDVPIQPLLVPGGAGGPVSAAETAGILVMGFPDRWRQDGLGAVRRAVAIDSPSPIVAVRRGVGREALLRSTR